MNRCKASRSDHHEFSCLVFGVVESFSRALDWKNREEVEKQGENF